jgi:hypothetical protein
MIDRVVSRMADSGNGQVFISYRSVEKALRDWLKRVLTEMGVLFWVDETLDVGEIWRAQVARRARECSALLLLWTQSAAEKSDEIYKEVSLALDRGRKVIVLRFSNCEYPDALALLLCDRQAVAYDTLDLATAHGKLYWCLRQLNLATNTSVDVTKLPAPPPVPPRTPPDDPGGQKEVSSAPGSHVPKEPQSPKREPAHLTRLQQIGRTLRVLSLLDSTAVSAGSSFFTVEMRQSDWKSFLAEVEDLHPSSTNAELARHAPAAAKAMAHLFLSDYAAAATLFDHRLGDLNFENLRLALLAHLVNARRNQKPDSLKRAAMCVTCLKYSPELWTQSDDPREALRSLDLAGVLLRRFVADLAQPGLSSHETGLDLAAFVDAEDASAACIKAAGANRVQTTSGVLDVAYGYGFHQVYGKRIALLSACTLDAEQREEFFSDLSGLWYLANHGRPLEVLESPQLAASLNGQGKPEARLLEHCAISVLQDSLAYPAITSEDGLRGCQLAFQCLGRSRPLPPSSGVMRIAPLLVKLIGDLEERQVSPYLAGEMDKIVQSAEGALGQDMTMLRQRAAQMVYQAKARENIRGKQYDSAIRLLDQWTALAGPTPRCLALQIKAQVRRFYGSQNRAALDAAESALQTLKQLAPDHTDLAELDQKVREARKEDAFGRSGATPAPPPDSIDVPMAPSAVASLDDCVDRYKESPSMANREALLECVYSASSQLLQSRQVELCASLLRGLFCRLPDVSELTELSMQLCDSWKEHLGPEKTLDFLELLQQDRTPTEVGPVTVKKPEQIKSASQIAERQGLEEERRVLERLEQYQRGDKGEAK